MTVEPLAPPADSTPVTVEGVTLALPRGWHSDRQEHDHATVVRLFEDDDPNPVVFMSVGAQPKANATAVGIALDGASRAWTGVARDLVRGPVSWTSAPDAAAIQFHFTDPNGVRGECDGLIVATHSPEGDTVAVVSAIAPAGALGSSAAYDVLRTLTFD
ncbi:hypothetical protein [Cellulomonas sp. PhB150]|uniref:hypothetical protein n=1 Tax=Cellulomonas sp. PhB150 TaxID=2485188 RepID=UPI001315654E|nr:hypothetical protein [Cellulomonas sp. PhB150]